MSKQNNKQIINALPQDLINRIKKESVKRKPITVIDPIPNIKKRGGAKVQQEATVKAKPASSQNTVILDHSYCMTDNSSSNSKCEKTVKKIQPICNQQSQNPINTVKDSGCTSSENDDKTVISMQPTVKNADGTLMVSLLKTNTIHKVESAQTNRKKLNLEEYKKRNGLVTSTSNSQGCSPKNSSPTPEEDTHQKMLRHQEKLRKMAEELLKTTPKSEQKKPEIEVPPVSSFEFKSPQDPPENIDPPYKLPAHLECKVFVSFGTNTDFRISKDQRDPLAPVAKLQEIKPLIDHVVKNTENSLISSVMETIPKLIEQSERPNKAMPQTEPDEEHGEFKRVVYMKKDRARCPTREVATQTNVSLIEQSKEKHTTSSARCSRKNSPRSRNNSTSSVSSRSSNHSYSSRPSPYYSRSSDYSSRSSSRLSFGRSRSRSPAYSSRSRNSNADEDHLNAVEERRIIYVGRISRNTTKDDLRRKFRKFGPINKISLHFRDIGENYGFVTFQFKEDAHAAYEHGNDDPAFPYYKISFGGRREFCKAAYSDLDDVRVLNRLNYYPYQHHQYQQQADESFDRLLKDHIYQLKKRKA